MHTTQALLLALLQGVTELFPVSSLGHAVVVPSLLHWQIDQHDPAFLPFLVFLHLGTAVALFAYFWRDWFSLARGWIGRAAPEQVRESRHILLLLVIATLPALIFGFAFEGLLRALFASPRFAALFLVANGILLLVADRSRRGSVGVGNSVAELRLMDALVIGLWQCLAFLPGISRSGATMLGGVRRGLDHHVAARFSFLIALPVILAATASQSLRLRHLQAGQIDIAAMAEAAVVAGLAALISTAILMRYFRRHESWALAPFGIYCLAFGAIAFGMFYL